MDLETPIVRWFHAPQHLAADVIYRHTLRLESSIVYPIYIHNFFPFYSFPLVHKTVSFSDPLPSLTLGPYIVRTKVFKKMYCLNNDIRDLLAGHYYPFSFSIIIIIIKIMRISWYYLLEFSMNKHCFHPSGN